MTFFAVRELAINFGGVQALDGVSFEVEPGEVFTIIGPNGAGKTTIFNLISRIYDPTRGELLFRDEDITRVPPHDIARRGIARTFQNIELFEHATVLQNLLLGRHTHRRSRFFEEILALPRVRALEVAEREAAEKVIDFLDLQPYRDTLIVNLPYGVRKVVEMGRALCTEPKLLLLDEPSSGLSVEETEDMAFWIEDITEAPRHHGLDGRARHEPGQRRVRPRARAELRAPDRAGHGARGPAASRGHQGVPGGLIPMAEALLTVNNIETFYGPIMAIRGVSFSVTAGSIVTILGANGAGKTTILKTVSGVMDPQKGTVVFDGREIQRKDPDKVVRLGLSHVPEGREVFPFLSVRENLRMGAYTRTDADAAARDLEIVFGYFPVLKERAEQRAGQLSGGEQQMLSISRALMARPKMMLLDEPSLGLSPKLVKEIYEIILRINREQGVTVLLVEQNANMALHIAEYGYVLEVGRIVMEDTCARLLEKEDIKEFYLGVKEGSVRGTRRWKRKKTWR